MPCWVSPPRPLSQRSLLAGTPASRRSRGPRPTRRCWPHTPRTPRSRPARPRSRAPSTQSSRSSPPCSFPAAAELLTRRPGRASSSLCCAGQRRRHAEHHGRLLLHGGHLYGSFAGDEGAWSTAKMYFTVPPNGVAKLHFGAHFQAPGLPNQTAGTVDVYGLQILDATLKAGNTVEAEGLGAAAEARVPRRRGRRRHAGHPGRGAAGAHAHHARQFSGASSVASASFTVGGFQARPPTW